VLSRSAIQSEVAPADLVFQWQLPLLSRIGVVTFRELVDFLRCLVLHERRHHCDAQYESSTRTTGASRAGPNRSGRASSRPTNTSTTCEGRDFNDHDSDPRDSCAEHRAQPSTATDFAVKTTIGSWSLSDPGREESSAKTASRDSMVTSA